MLERTHPRARARKRWAGGRGGFLPSAVKGWLRLQASAQSGGEWVTWVDVINSNPGVTNAARRPAVAAANNGLPIATFATNDAVSVPLNALINNQTVKVGWALWVKVGDLGGFNTLLSISTGTAGASAPKLQLFLSSTEAVTIDAYAAGAVGRRYVSTPVITQNTWAWLRLRFDGSIGSDANAIALINGVAAAGSYSNLGLGAMPNTLATVTGNLIIGNINDGSASAALNGSIGPNVFFLDADLTAAEETALMNFEMPT